ncbi:MULTISPECIES: hypothetical protein [unclassified Polaromonas]|jgi:hypothetical protein|uniref:hypothetical protein n=1 Tax=unclassified Polaromonas TaxID=2638319 RepID=UPI0025D494E5|nr:MULTISPECIES: hypothetical protein [unclassified Polaromonas]HQR98394.1 hypothetical protein [Polaromonas sp.]HQS39171.1 hypothetical protein [Polaromonas sp.]HQS86459.1 hypothetical protein [Polaromonas sp.]HQT06910.1 hypothetical protein [Polaromonas sp.]
MRQVFERLLGLKNKTADGQDSGLKPAARTPATTTRDSQHTIEDNSDNGTRRQLVQMLLRDCLRRHGIAADWVECQMLVVNSRSRGPGVYVRLVLRHWDARLMTYAFAFQNELLAAITQFEPQSGTWLHGISWEFKVGDSCPFPDMPDPAIWGPPARAAAPAALAAAAPAAVMAAAPAVPADEAEDDVMRDLKDLQNMFAARDASIEQEAAAGAPADFQPTQPSGLG